MVNNGKFRRFVLTTSAIAMLGAFNPKIDILNFNPQLAFGKHMSNTNVLMKKVPKGNDYLAAMMPVKNKDESGESVKTAKPSAYVTDDYNMDGKYLSQIGGEGGMDFSDIFKTIGYKNEDGEYAFPKDKDKIDLIKINGNMINSDNQEFVVVLYNFNKMIYVVRYGESIKYNRINMKVGKKDNTIIQKIEDKNKIAVLDKIGKGQIAFITADETYLMKLDKLCENEGVKSLEGLNMTVEMIKTKTRQGDPIDMAIISIKDDENKTISKYACTPEYKYIFHIPERKNED